MADESWLPEKIGDYYNEGREIGRLERGIGPLELARIRELITRHLPPPPATVLDIGGGSGRYAGWLARKGYAVHLVDPVPLHIEQATAVSDAQPDAPIKSIQLGDARDLPFPDSLATAVLLHGPLYHLTERTDRLRVLREARRVVKPGGLLMAVAVSRFASALVGFQRWWLEDEDFRKMLEEELESGQHRPPKSWPSLFTTAYFHRPQELQGEIEEAGFSLQEIVAIQGPGWIVPDLEERMANARQRDALLTAVRRIEGEPEILGMSPHIMAVALNL